MPPRVFLVDDDPLIVGLVGTAMETAGLEFAAADKVAGALGAIQNYKPDVVLLDVMLPDGEGYEICRQLKQDPGLAAIPAIFLTSKGDVNSRIKGFSAGGIDYVPKPFAVPELIARVQAHLSVKAGQDLLRQKVDEMSTRQRVRQDIQDMILHDLRTPLSSIKVTLDLVRKSAAIRDPEYIKILHNAEDASDIALFMVNDILDLSMGKLDIKKQRVDMRLIIQRLQSLVGSRIKRLDLTFETSLDEKAQELNSDPSLIFRILLNLVTNAMKYSLPKKRVQLAIKKEDKAVRMQVADEGPGIPDEEKEKVFQMFYRTAQTEVLSKPGYGIGLAFCDMACHALGGRIWVENAKPAGSCFIAQLPA